MKRGYLDRNYPEVDHILSLIRSIEVMYSAADAAERMDRIKEASRTVTHMYVLRAESLDLLGTDLCLPHNTQQRELPNDQRSSSQSDRQLDAPNPDRRDLRTGAGHVP